MKVTPEIRKKIVERYNEGTKWRDLQEEFQLSSYTIKAVLDRECKSGSRKSGTEAFRATIAIDGEEGQWLASQSNINEAIRQLIADKIAYSQNEGGSAQEQNLASTTEEAPHGNDFPYSGIEGGSEAFNFEVVGHDTDENEVPVGTVVSFFDDVILEKIVRKTIEEKGLRNIVWFHANTVNDKPFKLHMEIVL